MTFKGRVTLTKKEAATETGQRLIHQIMAISHDGDITIDEVRALHQYLLSAPDQFAAIRFLRGLANTILLDGHIDQMEMYSFRLGLERVVPKSIRSQISDMLSSIGLPPPLREPDEPWTWRDDAMTERQASYIRDLGGKPEPSMTKGRASELIDELLTRRPPTPRQVMVIRFFGRLDLLERTKEEVSEWLDDHFIARPDLERAWDRYKLSVGDDGTCRDWSKVPIDGYLEFLRQPAESVNDPSSRGTGKSATAQTRTAGLRLPWYLWGIIATGIVAIAIVGWVAARS